MGMFDSIYTEWKCKECGYIANKLEYQTKALEGVLAVYKIGDKISLDGIQAKDFKFRCYGNNVHQCKNGWFYFSIEAKAVAKKNKLKKIENTEIKKEKIYPLSKEGARLKFGNKEGNATFWFDTRKKTGGWASVGGQIANWHPTDD